MQRKKQNKGTAIKRLLKIKKKNIQIGKKGKTSIFPQAYTLFKLSDPCINIYQKILTIK